MVHFYAFCFAHLSTVHWFDVVGWASGRTASISSSFSSMLRKYYKPTCKNTKHCSY